MDARLEAIRYRLSGQQKDEYIRLSILETFLKAKLEYLRRINGE